MESDLSLQKQWDNEIQSDNAYGLILEGKHVIFVPGLFNELADFFSNYFLDNINVAKKLGATTSYRALSSKNSVPENARILYEEIIKIKKEYEKPLILVGHSKGSAEILYMLLSYPHLIINNIINNTLLFQSAILGSPLAEQSATCFAHIAIGLLSPNLETLKPAIATRNFMNASNLYEDTLREEASIANQSLEALKEFFSSKINFICSEIGPGEEPSFGVNFLLGILGHSLEIDRHDGLLPLYSQSHPNIGNSWGVLNCDHAGLVIKRPLSNVSTKERKAFMHLAFRKLFND